MVRSPSAVIVSSENSDANGEDEPLGASDFEDTVKNLLKMKPKPHKGEGDKGKEGGVQKRRPPASGSSDESD